MNAVLFTMHIIFDWLYHQPAQHDENRSNNTPSYIYRHFKNCCAYTTCAGGDNAVVSFSKMPFSSQ